MRQGLVSQIQSIPIIDSRLSFTNLNTYEHFITIVSANPFSSHVDKPVPKGNSSFQFLFISDNGLIKRISLKTQFTPLKPLSLVKRTPPHSHFKNTNFNTNLNKVDNFTTRIVTFILSRQLGKSLADKLFAVPLSIPEK